MKRILLSLHFFLLACAPVLAQGISLGNITARVTDDEVIFDADIRANNLVVRCTGKITLEFAVENATQRMALPTVVYSTRSQTRLDARRELLSDDYTPQSFYIYDRVRRHDSYNLHYRQTIPYQTWMSGAKVTLREYTHDCGGDRVTATRLLLENLGPTPTQLQAQSPRIVYVEKPVYVPTPAAIPLTPATTTIERCKSCPPLEDGSVWKTRLRGRKK